MNRAYKRSAAATAAICIVLGLVACQPGSQEPRSKDKGPADSGALQQGTGTAANDATSAPNKAAGVEPARAVVAETLPYAEVNDELFYGHFVFPSDMVEPLPALIVVHEWWGLNDGIRDLADRLAAEGYIVLAIDLFGGRTALQASDARQLMREVLEHPENANENIRQAYAFVRDTAGAPRIGAFGRAFGGAWALNTALLFPDDLDAAVIYYGQVTDDIDKLKPLHVPLLGLFAEDDSIVSAESAKGFGAALASVGVPHEIEIYPNVGHAFANQDSDNYDADAATEAWGKAVAFLHKYLSRATAQ